MRSHDNWEWRRDPERLQRLWSHHDLQRPLSATDELHKIRLSMLLAFPFVLLFYTLDYFVRGTCNTVREFFQVGVVAAQWSTRRITVTREALDIRVQEQRRLRTTHPPRTAEQILYLILNKADREHIPGDLHEEYGQLVKRFGIRYARVWYWKQVLWSIRPVAYARFIRFARTIAIVELSRRLWVELTRLP